MHINKNNYEAFLLDLLEGNLSAEQEGKLNEFLKHHPELVVDMPDIELFSLDKNAISYASRDQLKKEFPGDETLISEANFDMFSIARMEGDLSPRQEQDYDGLLARDEGKRKEWQNWQKTMLVPEHITFPGKNSLKRKASVKTRWLWLSGISAAAAIALVFLLLRLESPISGVAEIGPSESLPEQEVPVETQEVAVEAAEANVESREMPVEDKDVPELIQEVLAEKQNYPLEEPEEASLEIEPRPLRIAGSLSSKPSMTDHVGSDQIKPLPFSPIPAKTSRLPMNEIAELDGQIIFDEFTKERNISILSVANAGIKGINKLTGSDISLMASRDEEGDVSGFRLKSKRFSVTRPLAREESEE